MEVREDYLTLTHARPLGSDRLFDLHDHLGLGPYLVGRVENRRTGIHVEVVGEAATETGPLLDDDLVSGLAEHLRSGRGQSNPVLVRLHLLGYANG